MTPTPSLTRWLVTCISLAGMLMPAGCTQIKASAADMESENSALESVSAAADPTPTPITAAAVDPALIEAGAPIMIEEPASLIPSSETEPLRFTFPTPETEFVSAWRPPLVPVPWALTPNDHFYFIRPIAADNVNWPAPDYRYGDLYPDADIVHTGVDIIADRGTPVVAAAEGRVTWAGEGLYRGINSPDDPYGKAVAIRHDFGYNQREIYTIYAHMDRVDVAVGQRVKAGDQVGVVGDTGNATGPHLHFEVRVKDNTFYTTRNPELWLAPPQGWGVLAGRLIGRYGFPVPSIKVYVTSLDTGTDWVVRTYGPTSVNGDDYYQENLVLSDLPAGKYRIDFRLNWKDYQHEIEIKPGMVTFFNFNERPGVFSDQVPEKDSKTIFTPALDDPSTNP